MTAVDRPYRLLAYAIGFVFSVGVLAMIVRSADRPDDPELGAIDPGLTVGPTAPGAPEPGGDPQREPFGGFGEVGLTVRRGDGTFIVACLLAALSGQERQRGLMEVTDLRGYDGMAFLYDEDTQGGFYMRNTPMPLSIAWISADGTVVSSTDMAPCEDREGCPTYSPAGPYRVAIEVPQGGLDDLGIEPGSTITVGGSCAPRT